jgi:hypothetical protein
MKYNGCVLGELMKTTDTDTTATTNAAALTVPGRGSQVIVFASSFANYRYDTRLPGYFSDHYMDTQIQ